MDDIKLFRILARIAETLDRIATALENGSTSRDDA